MLGLLWIELVHCILWPQFDLGLKLKLANNAKLAWFHIYSPVQYFLSTLQNGILLPNCSSDLKNFANSRPSAPNFKSFSQSLAQSLLIVGQKYFGNKIPFCRIYKKGLYRAINMKPCKFSIICQFHFQTKVKLGS